MTERKIIVQHAKSEFEFVLIMSFKPMNDTEGPDRLVPSALLFDEYPRMSLPENFGRRPTTDERGDITRTVRCEMKGYLVITDHYSLASRCNKIGRSCL